jgi:predicted flavoprotein YhiN
MRKVKIIPQEDGSFTIEGKESHPEIKGKKLIILTQGQLSVDESGKDAAGYKLAGDEAILLTEEEFESVKKKLSEKKSKAA